MAAIAIRAMEEKQGKGNFTLKFGATKSHQTCIEYPVYYLLLSTKIIIN